ncbi:YhdP family protein [Roseateles sp. BYS180W]|uniref:YhdP family protein n=1 Tax=Roseateles rivi TaxID=3299028 RepID=A0ABW7FT99_9BURK
MSRTAALRRLAKRPALWLRRAIFGVLALGLLLFVGTLAALHGFILPHINEWRPQIEQQASRALGVQLRLGELRHRPEGLAPALDLLDVRLIDAQGRQALHLPRVSAALSARSLLALELRFARLELYAPELLLLRDAKGRLSVAGLDVASGANTEASDQLMDWFFNQPQFVISAGRVLWQDELRQAPRLELQQLEFKLRNGLARHSFELSATPPAGWGERFRLQGSFRQPLLARAGELRSWSGTLQGELPRADVRQLRRHIDLPFELDEGLGRLAAKVSIEHGELRQASLDMALDKVMLRLAPHLAPLQLAKIEGRLSAARSAEHWSLEAQQLGFISSDGKAWPASDWSVQVQHAPNDPLAVRGGSVQAQHMDLAQAAHILQRLPLGAQQLQVLAQMQPQGRLEQAKAKWEGPLQAPRRYQLQGELLGLSLRPGEASTSAPHQLARPGVQGAELRFDLNERGGQARLRINKGSLSLPGVFEEAALPLTQLQAELNWRQAATQDGAAWRLQEVELAQLRLANADLRGELRGRWRASAQPLGELELNGQLNEVRATRVAAYLPLSLGAHARSYVRHALLGGQAQQARLRLKGPLDEFPFAQPQSRGEFSVALQVRDVRLAYVPSHPAEAGLPAYVSPWPEMERVQGELVFERAGMQLRRARAQLMGVELSNVQAQIPDLGHSNPVLDVSGLARGTLTDMLRFVRNSPVGGMTRHALDQAQAGGNAQLRLDLNIPLNHSDATRVKGQLQLADNSLRLRPDLPQFTDIQGQVDFNERGLQLGPTQLRTLGGNARLEGGSQPDGSLRFGAQGQVSAEGLRAATELGLTSRLAGFMSGSAPMAVEVLVRQAYTELNISSTLQGMSVELPAPLRKATDELWPLRYSQRSLPDSPAGVARDELRLELGKQVQAHYVRELPPQGEARVLRGAVGVHAPLPELPAQGVTARADTPLLSLDAWQRALPRLVGEAAEHGPGEGSYVPNQLSTRTQTLQVAGYALNKVVAGLTRDGPTWRATVDAEQLSGYLEFRPTLGSQPGRVYARLGRLALPRSEAESVERLLEQPPRSVPTLDIVVEDFELRGMRLGRLEVQAQQAAEAREWRLKRLLLDNPAAKLSAQGQWAAASGRSQRQTELDWRMEVHDAGALLTRLGHAEVVRKGQGQLSGHLSWAGSPLSPDYASMAGQLSVDVQDGQFLRADPGAARLLGVLSLQSLPRRLLLDFRDVYSQGFAFDSFRGEIRIEQGVARSDNLTMKGVHAVVRMQGSTHLASETQNLHVLVVPEINAGGAALAYAAVNPALALGTFVAQWLIGKPLAAANTDEFSITGSWTEPRVEQLQRRRDAPASTEPGASAPTSTPTATERP